MLKARRSFLSLKPTLRCGTRRPTLDRSLPCLALPCGGRRHRSRPHFSGLRALVETGSIPLDSAEDKVAEIISLATAGCVIPLAAAASGVPPGAWLERTPGGMSPLHVLVPSSHIMRLCLAHKVFPRRQV